MANQQRRNNEEKSAYWRDQVANWRRSGLSQTRFCRAHDIKQSTLSYWIRRLGPLSAQPAVRPNFIEITAANIVGALRPETPPAPLALTIAGRYQLEIRGDFAPQVLEKVVRTLERL